MFYNIKLILGTCFSLLIFVTHNYKESEVSAPLIQTQTLHKLKLKHLESYQQIQVWANDQLLTAYHYSDTLEKPFLYPVNTLAGKILSRGFPYEPRVGERTDHPHHVGIWMNYGNVNGIDYWNNSFAKRNSAKKSYGVIRHREVVNMKERDESVSFLVRMDWLDTDGTTLLTEEATFTIRNTENTYSISRISTLTAQEKRVNFTDNKEGFFAIRVAKELEHPITKPAKRVMKNGQASEKAISDTTGVYGEYLSSEGIYGMEVWGTRAKWMQLSSFIGGDPVQVFILDHPQNPGYPTYWHARGYGLFSANPLGQKIFSHDKKVLDFFLPPRQSRTFKYQVLIHEGTPLGTEQIEQAFEAFSRE